MSLTFTKKQTARMAELLDSDQFFDSTHAAEAALALAQEIIAERGKFTIVGQVMNLDGTRGDKIALGYYATEKQALDDALKLALSTVTNEQHLVWVLPVHHGTPHSYYRSRLDKRKAEAMQAGSVREQELARRVAWCADNPGKPVPPEWGVVPFESELDACPFCDGLGKVAA